MDFTKFKHLIKPAEGESFSASLIRRIGFFGVAIVEFLLNINFFISLGESWIMPFAGGVLVLMNVWHWVTAQNAYGIKRIFHYAAWFSICIISVLAVIAFGQAITTVTSADVSQAVSMDAYKQQARIELLSSAKKDKATIQLQIDDIIAKKQAIGIYDKGPAERLENQLKEARTALKDAEDRILKYSGNEDASDTKQVVAPKKNISAQIIFSQIFSEKQTESAIKGFFLIFGVAMQLTLSLSAIPPKKKEKKKKVSFFNRWLRQRYEREILSRQPIVQAPQAPVQPIVVMTQPTPQPQAPQNYLPATEQAVVAEAQMVQAEPIKEVPTEIQTHPIEPESIQAIEEPVAHPKAEPKPAEPEKPAAPAESETAFLFFKDIEQLRTLNPAEKSIFLQNIDSIFNIIKQNGDKELSIREIADGTQIPIQEIRKIFKYFYSRSLLTYDDMNHRWKFKLHKDNVINYLKDKSIQY